MELLEDELCEELEDVVVTTLLLEEEEEEELGPQIIGSGVHVAPKIDALKIHGPRPIHSVASQTLNGPSPHSSHRSQLGGSGVLEELELLEVVTIEEELEEEVITEDEEELEELGGLHSTGSGVHCPGRPGVKMQGPRS